MFDQAHTQKKDLVARNLIKLGFNQFALFQFRCLHEHFSLISWDINGFLGHMQLLPFLPSFIYEIYPVFLSFFVTHYASVERLQISVYLVQLLTNV